MKRDLENTIYSAVELTNTRRASERLPLHRGFTPINSFSTRSHPQQADDAPPRRKKSTQKKANAAVKRTSRIRETILESSLILTQTDPEWLQGDCKSPSTNSKKKRTVSQDLIQSGSNVAFTGLKKVKSGSPCFSFNLHAAIPSTSNRPPSPCNTLNTSKDDASAGLSTSTINNIRSFIYRPVEIRASLFTNELNGGTAARERKPPPLRSDASEVGPELTIESCQHSLNLDLHAQSLERVSDRLLNAYPSHQSDLGEEVNGLSSGLGFLGTTAEVHTAVWNAFPDFRLSGTQPAAEPGDNFSDLIHTQDVRFRQETDEHLTKDQPENFGRDQNVGDFETDYDDYAWNIPSNEDPHSIKHGVSTTDVSKLHQETDEFDADSDDNEFLALYEALRRPIDDDTIIDALAFPQQPPDSDIGAEEWIYDAEIGDEDWNALYDINTSASTTGRPELIGAFDDLDAMDVVGRNSAHLLPPMDDPTDGDLVPESNPAKFFESDKNDFDDQIDEEDLLQAEAQVLQSRECDIPEDEFGVDESVLLQAERDVLSSAAVTLERSRMNKRWALPANTPKSSWGRKEIPSPKSLQRRPTARQSRQESVRDGPIDPTPPSPVSLITILSKSSPIRKALTSSSRSTQDIPPFVRSPFPKAVTSHCPIYGVSNKSMLRVCFRMAEVFKAASSQRSSDTTVTIEFYAAVTHSSRCAEMQTFNFADLFFPTRPPFLTGSYDGWKGSQLYEHDTGTFLDASPTRLRMCRAIGTLTRTVAGQLDVKILNIWESSWEDVNWVRGIVSP